MSISQTIRTHGKNSVNLQNVLVDQSDYERLKNTKISVGGTCRNPVPYIKVEGKNIQLNRFLMGLKVGERATVSFANRNKGDFRRENLKVNYSKAKQNKKVEPDIPEENKIHLNEHGKVDQSLTEEMVRIRDTISQMSLTDLNTLQAAIEAAIEKHDFNRILQEVTAKVEDSGMSMKRFQELWNQGSTQGLLITQNPTMLLENKSQASRDAAVMNQREYQTRLYDISSSLKKSGADWKDIAEHLNDIGLFTLTDEYWNGFTVRSQYTNWQIAAQYRR